MTGLHCYNEKSNHISMHWREPMKDVPLEEAKNYFDDSILSKRLDFMREQCTVPEDIKAVGRDKLISMLEGCGDNYERMDFSRNTCRCRHDSGGHSRT
jgi:hypothetical protein